MSKEPNFDEVLLSHLLAEESDVGIDEATITKAKAKFLDSINKRNALAKKEANEAIEAVPEIGPHLLSPAADNKTSELVNFPSTKLDEEETPDQEEFLELAADDSVKERESKYFSCKVAGRSRSFIIEEVEGGIRLTAGATSRKDLGAVACWTIMGSSGELVLKQNANSIFATSELLPISYKTAVEFIIITWR